MTKPVEIVCSACGADALLIRKPVYEGLRKTSETLSCSACGHVFENEEEVSYTHRATVQVFTEEDRSASVDVFEGDEARFCRHCRHYVVNPFTQWCGHHKREVQATDTCSHFDRREEEPKQTPI